MTVSHSKSLTILGALVVYLELFRLHWIAGAVRAKFHHDITPTSPPSFEVLHGKFGHFPSAGTLPSPGRHQSPPRPYILAKTHGSKISLGDLNWATLVVLDPVVDPGGDGGGMELASCSTVRPQGG